jgi:hypothetical protein
MAWFIERLLTNSVRLHSNRLDSEMLGYLLTLESKIKKLKGKELLTFEEEELIYDLQHSKTITQLSKEMGLSRVTTATKIDALTEKLSMYLGGIYTDEGYLSYMQWRYKLNEREVQMLREKITGNYKRFYLR